MRLPPADGLPITAPDPVLAAAGRDRVIDAARAVSMLAVAVGHWLVVDVQRGAGGGLRVVDVLAELPSAQYLSWLFQVMPVFFVAGGVVGFRSWQRHRSAGGTAPAWVSARLWRLLWPTLPVVGFWVVATQVGRHLLDVDADVLAASRGIALVIWFLAVYAVVTALLPALAAACDRWGVRVPIGLALAAAAVDLIGAATGYVSSTRPSWMWVNYLTVWSAILCLGRWWADEPQRRQQLAGVWLALGGAVVLLVVTGLRWYPISMVGVAGQTRSNSLPPTIALLSLGVLQYGILLATRPFLARGLARPRVYGAVMLLGARAMTVYLWHLLAVAVLTLGFVLTGIWPDSVVGTGAWWGLRAAWVLAATLLTVPIVWLAARTERPPAIPTTSVPWRTAAATVAAMVGWAGLAIGGFHQPAMPLGLPIVPLVGLGAAVLLLRTAPVPTIASNASVTRD